MPLARATTWATSFPGKHRAGLVLPFCPGAGGSAGLIHKVNGLIRQAAPRQIPHGELHGFPQGLRRQLDTVIPLIAGCQPLQNANSLLRSRLFDLHLSKAAFEGGVFLDRVRNS